MDVVDPPGWFVLQEDVVKLTEKCGLNSTGSSPVVTPLRTPEDLKSNILKAQAEAAALKVCCSNRLLLQDLRHSVKLRLLK